MHKSRKKSPSWALHPSRINTAGRNSAQSSAFARSRDEDLDNGSIQKPTFRFERISDYTDHKTDF
jgi:hypothetical protein